LNPLNRDALAQFGLGRGPTQAADGVGQFDGAFHHVGDRVNDRALFEIFLLLVKDGKKVVADDAMAISDQSFKQGFGLVLHFGPGWACVFHRAMLAAGRCKNDADIVFAEFRPSCCGALEKRIAAMWIA
jgi:hypothetical protein